MTRREKLIQKIVQRPSTASFGDVRKVLEMYGWERAPTKGKGSHARFRKPGERSITVPVHHDKVERVYLDQICNRLGLDAEAEAQ